MVGGVFFTTGGYASVLQVANAPRGAVPTGSCGRPWRWWSTEPGRLDWASAVALFVGTLYFGASLAVALIGDLTTAQMHRARLVARNSSAASSSSSPATSP